MVNPSHTLLWFTLTQSDTNAFLRKNKIYMRSSPLLSPLPSSILFIQIYAFLPNHKTMLKHPHSHTQFIHPSIHPHRVNSIFSANRAFANRNIQRTDIHFDFNFIYCFNVPTLSLSPPAPARVPITHVSHTIFADSSPVLTAQSNGVRVDTSSTSSSSYTCSASKYHRAHTTAHTTHYSSSMVVAVAAAACNLYGISSGNCRPCNATQHQTQISETKHTLSIDFPASTATPTMTMTICYHWYRDRRLQCMRLRSVDRIFLILGMRWKHVPFIIHVVSQFCYTHTLRAIIQSLSVAAVCSVAKPSMAK